MKKTIIYNKKFFKLSETFIERQYNLIREILNVTLLGKTYTKKHIDSPVYLMQRLIILEKKVTGFLNLKSNSHLFFSTFIFLLLNKIKYGNNLNLHIHFGTNAVVLYRYLKIFKIPFIVSFHGRDASAALGEPHYKSRIPQLLKSASAIIISSRHMEESLRLCEYMSKVHYIPYAVDTEKLVAEKYFSKSLFSQRVTNILHVGRLTSKKGVPDLIRAFFIVSNRYENIKLHIVGQGLEYDLCKKVINENDLSDKVVMYGAKEQDEVMQYIANCDIFVLNSRVALDGDMEGLPNVLLEAMAMGKPIVSTKHAGIPAAIINNKTGLLIEEKNNDELVHAMDTLIKSNNLRRILGENARLKVVEEFNFELMKKRLLKVYLSV